MNSCTKSRVALAGAIMLAGPAVAQGGRVQAPAPSPGPGIQKPSLDPTIQAISALRLRLDALRESVGRQVVVLHFTPSESNGWLDSENNWSKNNQRSEAICKQALGDRYGRVLSRQPQVHPTAGRWYFSHVVCETIP